MFNIPEEEEPQVTPTVVGRQNSQRLQSDNSSLDYRNVDINRQISMPSFTIEGGQQNLQQDHDRSMSKTPRSIEVRNPNMNVPDKILNPGRNSTK